MRLLLVSVCRKRARGHTSRLVSATCHSSKVASTRTNLSRRNGGASTLNDSCTTTICRISRAQPILLRPWLTLAPRSLVSHQSITNTLWLSGSSNLVVKSAVIKSYALENSIKRKSLARNVPIIPRGCSLCR
jgi:hypothetical protein